MTPMVVHSHMLCEANRELTFQTHYRIASNRRLLNPVFEVSGASGKPRPQLYIERWSNNGLDPATTQYIVTYGAPNGGAGTILLSMQKGLESLKAFLESVGINSPEVEAACLKLAEKPRCEIPTVKSSTEIVRMLGRRLQGYVTAKTLGP